MRKSWLTLFILSTACGHIKSDKPTMTTTTIRDVAIDEAFQLEAQQRLAALDAQILDLQSRLKAENANREELESELKQAMFLKTWESIRTIQPCGSKFPNLSLNLGKRVAYSFISVRRLNAPNDSDIPAGPLNPGEYFFPTHMDCPFRVELANEPIDVVGQTALSLTNGEVQVQRVCWTDQDRGNANVCSTVLGDRKP